MQAILGRSSRAVSMDSMSASSSPNMAVRNRSRTFTNRRPVEADSREDTTSSLESSSKTSLSDMEDGGVKLVEGNELEERALGMLSSNPKLCAAALEGEIGEVAMEALVKVLAHSRRLLPLIRDQIHLEFLHNLSEQESILRGNCVASRMMSSYAAFVGNKWLCKSLRPTVEILLREDFMWTVDASRIAIGTQEEKDATAAKAQARLTEVATLTLRKIQKNLGRVPIQVRAMVYLIWMNSRTFSPDRTAALLGGFVFLRLLNPALVDPGKVRNLIHGDDPVRGAIYKYNSIALCKVLQNLSNRKLYSDSGMASVNVWLEENMEPLETFLLDLATDPARAEGARPFREVLEGDPTIDVSLRSEISLTEWESLHVALVKAETHVKTRMTLSPLVSMSEDVSKLSTSSQDASGSSTPQTRSRQGSRIRAGEGETELTYSPDGKIRVRGPSSRRGSVLGKRPSLSKLPSLDSPQGEGGGDATSSASVSPPTTPSIFASLPRSPQVRAVRSSSLAGGEMPRLARAGSVGGPGAVSQEQALSPGRVEFEFYALLHQIPLPHEFRLEEFKEQIKAFQRGKLVEHGLLTEKSVRASQKMTPSQVEVLVQIAAALLHRDFGLIVDSFTLAVALEWMDRWLQVKQEKEVEQLLNHMVRHGLLEEKTYKEMRGYRLDQARIVEMAKLVRPIV